MDLGATVVADEQPLEVVQPGEGALNDPAHAPEPGAVSCLAVGDEGSDAPFADEAAVRVVVVAAIGDEGSGAEAGPADGAAHGRHLVGVRYSHCLFVVRTQ